jgi:hypothetical protein
MYGGKSPDAFPFVSLFGVDKSSNIGAIEPNDLALTPTIEIKIIAAKQTTPKNALPRVLVQFEINRTFLISFFANVASSLL